MIPGPIKWIHLCRQWTFRPVGPGISNEEGDAWVVITDPWSSGGSIQMVDPRTAGPGILPPHQAASNKLQACRSIGDIGILDNNQLANGPASLTVTV
jgi:hypothetical protein